MNDDHAMYILSLNKYQRDNLLWLLNLCGYPAKVGYVEPFQYANTGDWLGEVAIMLSKDNRKEPIIDEHDRPSVSRQDIQHSIERWISNTRTKDMNRSSTDKGSTSSEENT